MPTMHRQPPPRRCPAPPGNGIEVEKPWPDIPASASSGERFQDVDK